MKAYFAIILGALAVFGSLAAMSGVSHFGSGALPIKVGPDARRDIVQKIFFDEKRGKQRCNEGHLYRFGDSVIYARSGGRGKYDFRLVAPFFYVKKAACRGPACWRIVRALDETALVGFTIKNTLLFVPRHGNAYEVDIDRRSVNPWFPPRALGDTGLLARVDSEGRESTRRYARAGQGPFAELRMRLSRHDAVRSVALLNGQPYMFVEDKRDGGMDVISEQRRFRTGYARWYFQRPVLFVDRNRPYLADSGVLIDLSSGRTALRQPELAIGIDKAEHDLGSAGRPALHSCEGVVGASTRIVSLARSPRTLNAVRIEPAVPSRGLVIFFAGGPSGSSYSSLVGGESGSLLRAGFSVLKVNYSGSAGDGPELAGRLRKEGVGIALARDAAVLYEHLRRSGDDPVAIVGESFGALPALEFSRRYGGLNAPRTVLIGPLLHLRDPRSWITNEVTAAYQKMFEAQTIGADDPSARDRLNLYLDALQRSQPRGAAMFFAQHDEVSQPLDIEKPFEQKSRIRVVPGNHNLLDVPDGDLLAILNSPGLR